MLWSTIFARRASSRPLPLNKAVGRTPSSPLGALVRSIEGLDASLRQRDNWRSSDLRPFRLDPVEALPACQFTGRVSLGAAAL
jgi:hypothetical protein